MRAPGWEARLEAYLHGRLRQPFDRVGNNCAHFILGALCATKNVAPADVLAQLKADFPKTKTGVDRFVLERGDMRGIAEQYFGRPPSTAMLCAKRGDIALLKGKDGDTLGVVTAGGVVYVTDEGLATCDVTAGLGFWAIDV